MTVIELLKRLNIAVSQGAGHNEVYLHQWHEGMEPLTAVEFRPDGRMELYSNTAAPCQSDNIPPAAESPKCMTCNGKGMIGRAGYYAEPCPECVPAEDLDDEDLI